MKVSELTGPFLAYWVARAQGRENIRVGDGVCSYSEGTITYQFFPHERWDHGGPIIEREGITIARHEWWLDGPSKPPTGQYWRAYMCKPGWKKDIRFSDDTALANAMRCFVASRYGEEVPDE